MSQRISFKVFFMALILAAVFMPTFGVQVSPVASVGTGLHTQDQVDLAVGPVTQIGPSAASEMLQFKAVTTLLGFREPRPTWWAWIMR